MRKIFSLSLIALVFIGAGCLSSPIAQNPPAPAVVHKTPRPEGLTFGGDVFFMIDQSHRFEDGMTMLLTGIDDSRCPANVQCIWAGELAPTVRLTGGKFGTAMHEVRLGTERTPEATVGGYHLALVRADKASATLRISEVAVAAASPVHVSNVAANDVVTSPFTVKGEAPGIWFFEASFPVRLLDADGNVLVAVPASAGSDWMTTAYVPFEAKLTFAKPKTETGTLVLAKDNPSGLPEHDESFSIPVRFVPAK